MIIRKKTLLASLGIIIILSALLASVMLFSFTSADSSDYAVQNVVIDAGHGGEDPGAVADNGVLEKDLNLEISHILYDFFTLFGYNAVMTRNSDISLGNGEKFSKSRDIKTRVSIADEYSDSVLISIHMNKFTDKKYSGAQLFYSNAFEDNKIIADSMQANIKEYLDPENSRAAKQDNSIYIINNVSIPSVLCECGFISNDSELQKLMSDEYKAEISAIIFKSIDDYFNSKNG